MIPVTEVGKGILLNSVMTEKDKHEVDVTLTTKTNCRYDIALLKCNRFNLKISSTTISKEPNAQAHKAVEISGCLSD